MSPCKNCKALQNECTTKDPHHALKGGAVYTGHDGILERYSCRKCGAVWDRLKNKEEAKRNAHRWQMLVPGRTARH